MMTPLNKMILVQIEEPKQDEKKQSFFVTDDVVKINKLSAKTFTYKSDDKQKKHYGFIAQEVEKLYPSLITMIDGKKHVDYEEIIPILVKHVQILDKKINAILYAGLIIIVLLVSALILLVNT